jgi:hypothetical protein
MTARSLQHKFIAIDEGHATLLHINERDQSKNWIVPIGHLVLANWQGHGPGFGQSGIQLLEFNTEGGIVWHRSKADLISSLQGVLVLDGLDTTKLHDERNGLLEQVL